jgi:hypothetical protein
MSINQDIITYQELSPKVKLKKVWDLAKATPHGGQSPIIDVFDNNPLINMFVIVLGRRSGKSFSTAMIVLRELLIPYSNTILLSPSYKNSQIMFNETIKHIKTLGLPIASINKNQFSIELENGSKFTSVTSTNYESALGSRLSLLVVDETQSIPEIKSIFEEVLFPMFLDYGTKENGTLFAKAVFLGTPRGIGTAFHSLYLKELIQDNWKSFNSPSSCNPILPKVFLEQQRLILPDHVYRQELLAEWLSTGQGVFFAFNAENNLYDPEELKFSQEALQISGHDFGFSDSTAMLIIYVDRSGNYYIHDFYQQSARSTKEHVQAFKALEARNPGTLQDRFGDPSAAQTMLDLRSLYDYDVSKGNNRVAPGIACINDLMAVQGLDQKPKLFINKNLGELIRQIRSVSYKANTNGTDPFNKDPEGTHWDLLAAMRYAIYTHYRREQAGIIIS